MGFEGYAKVDHMTNAKWHIALKAVMVLNW